MMATRHDIINKVATAMPDLLKADVTAAVAIAFDHIADSVAAGNRVEIRGFGSFNIGERTLAPSTNLAQSITHHMPIKTINYRISQNLSELINRK
jgi:integration host factor subunit beta